MKKLMEIKNLLEKMAIDEASMGLYYFFYGRLLQYLSGTEMSFPLSAGVLRMHYIDTYLLEVIAGGDSFKFPMCGMTQGPYAYDIKTDYFICGREGMLECDALASFSTLFQSGQEISDLFTDNKGNVVLDGKTKAQKEKYRHLKYDAGGLWDAFCRYAPDYFCVYSGHMEEKVKDMLLEMYLLGIVDSMYEYYETGFCHQFSLQVRNAAVDSWFSFLERSDVDREDKNESEEVFKRLRKCFSEFTVLSTSVVLISQWDPACEHSDGGTKREAFEMYIVQADDVYFNGYSCTDHLQMGLIPPPVMIAMADTILFLESMDKKYHFLSKGEADDAKRKNNSKEIVIERGGLFV